jgi:DNA-binding transcriptional ArsR family regulator
MEGTTGAILMFKEALIPNIGAGQMRVELDKKSLFALASDTRVDILKSLQPMRRTVTQLAESLGIDKSAVHRHLKKLEEGGLVKRYEDHGFVYYGLSWKARDLMSPTENTKVIVLLSSSWIFVLIAAFLVLATFSSSLGGVTGGLNGDPQNAYGGNMTYDEQQRSILGSNQLPWYVYAAPAAGLAAIAVTLALLASQSIVRPKQNVTGLESAIPAGLTEDRTDD